MWIYWPNVTCFNCDDFFSKVDADRCVGWTEKKMFTVEILIQWGSEIQTFLDLKWSKRGWFENGPDNEQELKSGSPLFKWSKAVNGLVLNYEQQVRYSSHCYSNGHNASLGLCAKLFINLSNLVGNNTIMNEWMNEKVYSLKLCNFYEWEQWSKRHDYIKCMDNNKDYHMFIHKLTLSCYLQVTIQ